MATQAPSIKDVARRSGVSYKTVSRVVNGEAQVSVETRRRVQAAIADLGYVPHHGARTMRRGRTETLRFVVHNRTERFLHNPFQDEVVAGVVDAAQRRGYAVLIELTGEEDVAPTTRLPERRVDGTILNDGRVPLPLEGALVASGVPAVVISNRDLHPALGWIDADFHGGGRRLVQHLIDSGHRRIAHITDDPMLRTTQARRAGYEEALRAAGIAPDPDLIIRAGQLREQGCAATETLLARGKPFTAIYCVNDLTAFGAIDSLRQHGLRVPEDVSVTGYDDIALARFWTPPLTTIRLPWYEMAAAAVELVVGAIEGERPFPEGRELPVELCLRGSTGPARSRGSGAAR